VGLGDFLHDGRQVKLLEIRDVPRHATSGQRDTPTLAKYVDTEPVAAFDLPRQVDAAEIMEKLGLVFIEQFLGHLQNVLAGEDLGGGRHELGGFSDVWGLAGFQVKVRSLRLG
jgi:hypothetical protein